MQSRVVLIIDDDHEICEALQLTLENTGFTVMTTGDARSAIDIVNRINVHMIISDVQMPGMDGMEFLRTLKEEKSDIPILLITAYGTIDKAVKAMKYGAVDYIAKPFDSTVIVNMVERYSLSETPEVDDLFFSSADEKMMAIQSLSVRVAKSDATVMITGQSGTGKEVISRYIHLNSARCDGPFVAINCAAIPENMLEATLFGYEKGAYTGAYQSCPGKFEQAQNGTLLLDEISEMDMGLQAKLLRVLQEREVERLGGKKSIKLNVRVLATSNRDMKEQVKSGVFREDLYYRLNVFPLAIPPLRERKEDILPLANCLLKKHTAQFEDSNIYFSEGASVLMAKYYWPGNVRELENVIQRAVILCDGDCIEPKDLHLDECSVDTVSTGSETCLSDDLKGHEYKMIIDVLDDVDGNRKNAADRLGISQRTLRYKMAKMRDCGFLV